MVLHTIPGNTMEISKEEKRIGKLDDRFIMTIQGRDFVKYDGLLDLAHQNGLMKLEVEILQYPSKENDHTAICKSVAYSNTGETFSDIGDASSSNVNRMIAPHIIRMASTRAKARCLRDMCNIGFCCVEELGDMEDVIPANNKNRNTNKPNKNSSTSSPNDNMVEQQRTHMQQNPNPPEQNQNTKPVDTKPADNKQTNSRNQTNVEKPASSPGNAGTPKMSEAQRRAIENLAKRRGINEEQLRQMAITHYSLPVEQLSPQDAASFIRILQQSA